MMASLQNTAQLTHTASFDVSNILACRKRFKNDPAMSGITLGDIILYAVSRTLKDFPELNAHLLDNTLRVFNEVNLAVAVDTERGLMVPVIFNASQKTLPEISSELKTLAEQCRSGSISVDRLSGGSFTVSNLGQFGIESFTPILNAPQTGILGVNTIQQRVRVVDGCIGAYPCMTLSLTYDHRALDGAPASRFLQTLCGNLEKFETLGVL
jgi:pyruvate dehydrogenase E2 component (dihydrolipoamide acetyltransferase)